MRSKVLFGLLVGILGFPTSESRAQSRAMDAHFFRPALFSGGIFTTDRAAAPTLWQPSFGFFFNHEITPLRLRFPQQDGVCPGGKCIGTQDIISNAQVFNLQAQFGITKWLEFGIDVPMSRQSLVRSPAPGTLVGFDLLSVSDPKSNIPSANVSPLDMRVGLRFNVLQGRLLGLAVSVEGMVPFGDEEVFAGEKGPTIVPKILGSFTRGPLALTANFGCRVRPQSIIKWDDPDTVEQALPLLSLHTELTYGVGGVYQIHRVFGVGAEVYGAIPVGGGRFDAETRRTEYDSTKCPAGSPAGVPCEIVSSRRVNMPSPVVTEVLGGIAVSPMIGLTIAVGAGAGVGGVERRVALRLFSGITWLPGAKAPVIGDLDRDGDGIPDGRDQCPDQPEDRDGFQDEDGCPDLDNDGDGILDVEDKCPNVAEDKDGFEDQDGCPDLDNDGDRIPDAEDKCPNEPEDKDGFEDQDGCPDPDNDGDGILDKHDVCPNEPETVNGFQDEDGCPDSAPGVGMVAGKISIPEQIRFKQARAEIDPASHKLLDEIAKKILANPQAGKIRIEGHSDSTGRAENNEKLSTARAEAVRAYLVRKGVPAERLQAAGYGSRRPIAPNTTMEGQRKNRRVEFILIQTKEGISK